MIFFLKSQRMTVLVIPEQGKTHTGSKTATLWATVSVAKPPQEIQSPRSCSPRTVVPLSLAPLHYVLVLESSAGNLGVMCLATGSKPSVSCTGSVVTSVRTPGICAGILGTSSGDLNTSAMTLRTGAVCPETSVISPTTYSAVPGTGAHGSSDAIWQGIGGPYAARNRHLGVGNCCGAS